jgi:hypothetical protein
MYHGDTVIPPDLPIYALRSASHAKDSPNIARD